MSNKLDVQNKWEENTHTSPLGRINASGRMTRMTGPDCAVMCNLINTHTQGYVQFNKYTHTPGEKEAKKRKRPLNSCRRQGGNGGDFGGTRKRCRKGSVGPVAANSNIVEINKEAGGGAQGTLSLSKNCTSRESVSPLSRLIRGFRNKYH